MPRHVARLILLVALLAIAAPAAAHPLGLPASATVSFVSDTAIEVRWTAALDDLAALAQHAGVTVADDPGVTELEAAFAASRAAVADEVTPHVRVTVAAGACITELTGTRVATEGLHLTVTCPGPLDAVEMELSLLLDVDPRYRTIVRVTGDDESRLLFTDARRRQPLVPGAVGGTPRQDGLGAPGDRAPFGGSFGFERSLLAYADRPDLGWAAGITATLVALLIGALHGLAPGHGKAIGAAYLVGDRGRPRHAVALGATVAAMHTASIIVIGAVLWSAAAFPGLARLSAWLQLVTGAVVVAIGAVLVARRVATAGGRAEPHTHDHQPSGAPAGHVPDPPLSRGRLAALGAAGGLLPSPSGLLVFVSSLATGRVAVGVLLVLAFAVGLAASVTLAGLAVIWGREAITARLGGADRIHRWSHRLSLLGAGAVVVLGVIIAVNAVAALT